MAYVIFGHMIIYYSSSINISDFPRLIGTWYGVLMQGGLFAVDVFFFLSGFLAAFILLKKVSRNCCGLLHIYFHRWYRLALPMALTILISLFIIPYLISGPFSYTFKGVGVQQCVRYWWSNFLFINNFIPTHIEDECLGWTWYLANDFQFFLIGPPLVLLFKSKPRLVYCICALLFIITSALSYSIL